MSGPEFVLVLTAMGMTSGLIFSVVRIVGRYLERKQTGNGPDLAQLRAEVEALRAELAEQQDERQRLLELEERVDFAERLLTRERGQALPKGE